MLNPDASLDSDASLDPVDGAALRAQAHAMLDHMLDHMATLRDGPVWTAPPPALRERRRSALPRTPTALSRVHATFREEVLPYHGGNAHPGFMGWVQGAGTPVGMLAEMLAAGLNANCGGRDHMAVEVEREVTGWTRELFGFPVGADGLFVTGASQANFIGVLVARLRALGPGVRATGLSGAPGGGGGLHAYSSTAAHGCVARAMDMAGLGSDALRRIATGPDHRIDLDALRRAIDQDRAAGLTPFLIVGNAGTVDTGAIDDLEALADVALSHAMSFHVDGAFGALAALSPALQPRLRGLERADSLAFDWHKWGHAPYEAGYILVRDGARLRATFAADAAYLQRADTGLAAGEWWACDHGPDLSRGFKALKVWFTLKTYGAEVLGRAIDANCALARTLVGRIAAEPSLVQLAPAPLNIVCFGVRGHDACARNAAIVARLHAQGRVAPSLTRIDGRTAIRAAFVNHRSDVRDVEALLQGVLAADADLTVERAA